MSRVLPNVEGGRRRETAAVYEIIVAKRVRFLVVLMSVRRLRFHSKEN